MSVPSDQNQAQVQETKQNDKEFNFRKQEEYFKKQLDQERQARIAAEQKAAELSQAKTANRSDDEEDDDEPYVDKKRLNKTLDKFGQKTKQETQAEIKQAVYQALEEERKVNYLKSNNDFNEIMSAENVEKFAEKYPTLAEGILKMPDGFERQKLVYENIKALGVHKKDAPQSTIQEKVDANRKSPYYQPSGVGTAPYGHAGAGGKSYSGSEMKNAYEQMQQLKARLRI